MMMCTAEYFANELNRHRPLTEDEVGKLTAAMTRAASSSRRIWTAKEDRDLCKLARKHQATAIAEMTGRTVWSVRSRIRTLKRKEKQGG